jgi:hypothetical protein
MALNASALTNAVASHASTTGLFDAVNGHEPKNAPGGHLSCAVWIQSYSPVDTSGLASTSMRLEFNVRIYTSMLQEPVDAIDPEILDAVDLLLADYIGNFTLGGLIRDVDVRGADGNPLKVDAGYLSQDGKVYRVMTITLPLIINDLYAEAA